MKNIISKQNRIVIVMSTLLNIKQTYSEQAFRRICFAHFLFPYVQFRFLRSKLSLLWLPVSFMPTFENACPRFVCPSVRATCPLLVQCLPLDAYMKSHDQWSFSTRPGGLRAARLNNNCFPTISVIFRLQKLRLLAFPGPPGGFRELREAGRNHLHLSWYLIVPGITSYGPKLWGNCLPSTVVK